MKPRLAMIEEFAIFVSKHIVDTFRFMVTNMPLGTSAMSKAARVHRRAVFSIAEILMHRGIDAIAEWANAAVAEGHQETSRMRAAEAIVSCSSRGIGRRAARGPAKIVGRGAIVHPRIVQRIYAVFVIVGVQIVLADKIGVACSVSNMGDGNAAPRITNTRARVRGGKVKRIEMGNGGRPAIGENLIAGITSVVKNSAEQHGTSIVKIESPGARVESDATSGGAYEAGDGHLVALERAVALAVGDRILIPVAP